MNKNVDYIGKTVYYLKNYNQFKISVKNLTEDIEVLQQTMQLEAVAPIAKYVAILLALELSHLLRTLIFVLLKLHPVYPVSFATPIAA